MNKFENFFECFFFRYLLLGKGGKRGKDVKKFDRGEVFVLFVGEG